MIPTSAPSPAPCEALFHIAFYKFAPLRDADAVVLHLRQLTRDLLGSILVAPEGINGVLSGTAGALDAFEYALQHDAQLEGSFAGIAFKRSACKTAPFGRIKITRKAEIVAFGVPGASGLPAAQHGADRSKVSPQEWRTLLAQDDVVVIDNRNGFEYRLGKFKAALEQPVAHFRDFPQYVHDNAPAWRAAGKKVAMYCTGGIRCEKSSAWMQDLGLEVYQLEGGILNYFQSMPDAERDWEGECFVFDNRIALDTRLQETGTTLEQVYEGEVDGQWRLERARRLDPDS